jgi:molybdopterin molybdotransferase
MKPLHNHAEGHEGLLSVAQALQRLRRAVHPCGLEKKDLHAAVGRVLGVPISAPQDLPPFDASAMDGYAVRAADLREAAQGKGVELKVVGDIPAGLEPRLRLRAGTAARVMTGAMIPPGADCVVPVEWTDRPGPMAGEALPRTIRVFRSLAPGDHVRRAGSHLKAGTRVLEAGRRLGAAEVASIAAVGLGQVDVYQIPRVAIFSTGDELLEPGQPLRPGMIYDANGFGLAAAVRQAGAQPVFFGILPDARDALERLLDRILAAGVDLILSSAGVSMGARDYVRPVIEARGHLEFWRVNVRPGKPLAFGQLQGVPFLGLPGNPVSALVAFEVFVRPVLAWMGGEREPERLRVMARLEEPIHSDGRQSFLRGVVSWSEGGYRARLTGSQDSSLLTSLVQANALLIVPAGVKEVAAGQFLEAWLINS